MAKAWNVEKISPDKSLDECARRIISTRVREMMSYKEGAIDGKDIEFVHDMRVSSRRLRAAMQNFSECFAGKKKPFRKLLKKVENVTSTMGDVRDLDVLISFFEKDMKHLSKKEQPGVKKLIEYLKEDRKIKRQPMLKMFQSLDQSGFEKEFATFFEVN